MRERESYIERAIKRERKQNVFTKSNSRPLASAALYVSEGQQAANMFPTIYTSPSPVQNRRTQNEIVTLPLVLLTVHPRHRTVDNDTMHSGHPLLFTGLIFHPQPPESLIRYQHRGDRHRGHDGHLGNPIAPSPDGVDPGGGGVSSPFRMASVGTLSRLGWSGLGPGFGRRGLFL